MNELNLQVNRIFSTFANYSNKIPNQMDSGKIININIAKILKQKAPNKKFPRFIINYLRRIIHEDDFNKLFKDNAGKKNLDFIEASLNLFDVTATIENTDKLPSPDGKYIFASNHPLGGLDGMTLGLLLGKVYKGKIRLFTNDLLMYVHPLHEMFIPVNKTGSQGKNHAETLLDFFQSDNHLITFPAGMCSRKANGEIMDLDWKKSFIAKAVQYQRDVVPIYFEGRNSNFFYNLAKFRKFLGIKLNL